ncbi:MAG: hypothetical protein ACOX3R_15845 [Desulfitobacteriia bacterium]
MYSYLGKIVVCADTERAYAKYGQWAIDVLIYLDCAAAIENKPRTKIPLSDVLYFERYIYPT